jgi:seryl-tRNA synthetase
MEKEALVKEELVARVKKEQQYVQDTLIQLEATRILAEQLETDLQKEKEYGLELVTDRKKHKSHAQALEAENRNYTAQVSALTQMLSNKTKHIMLLTAQLKAKEAEEVDSGQLSEKHLQLQLHAAVSFSF